MDNRTNDDVLPVALIVTGVSLIVAGLMGLAAHAMGWW